MVALSGHGARPVNNHKSGLNRRLYSFPLGKSERWKSTMFDRYMCMIVDFSVASWHLILATALNSASHPMRRPSWTNEQWMMSRVTVKVW
jgi:hypothetical protein